MDLPLTSMTTAEKLDAMEQLWTALQAEDHPPPQWHGDVLGDRSRRIGSGESTFAPLDEVVQRIERLRD